MDDSYIVRIYRRDCQNTDTVAGVVEDVRQGTRQAFHTKDDLWDAVLGRKRPQRPLLKGS